MRSFIVISFSLLLVSCAATEGNSLNQILANAISKPVNAVLDPLVGKPLQYIEDSIRGYRVQFVTIPAGANITCDSKTLGKTPLLQYFDLTKEQESNAVFKMDNCVASWTSGVTAKVNIDVPLDQYPRNVYIVTERPSNSNGYEIDEQYGAEHLAAIQEQINQLVRNAVATTAAIMAINEMKDMQEKRQAYSSFGMNDPLDIPVFGSAQDNNGIRWNWISSDTSDISNAIKNNRFNNSSTMTPMYPASSCTGSISMGRCYGTLKPTKTTSYCAGEFVNGRCVGSVIYGPQK